MNGLGASAVLAGFGFFMTVFALEGGVKEKWPYAMAAALAAPLMCRLITAAVLG